MHCLFLYQYGDVWLIPYMKIYDKSIYRNSHLKCCAPTYNSYQWAVFCRCVFICCTKFTLREHFLLQKLHFKGFSKCILRCTLKLDLDAKCLTQNSQIKWNSFVLLSGFASHFFLCWLNESARENERSHSLQRKPLWVECVTACLFRVFVRANDFPHTLQL